MVRYDYIKIDNKTVYKKWINCYVEIYKNIKDIQQVNIYLFKNYSNIKQTEYISNNNFTDEELKEYFEVLKNCGFNFTITDNVKTTADFYHKEKEHDCIKVTIVIKENSILSNLILLNAFRNLHEQELYLKVKFLLSLKDCDLTDYNKLLLAESYIRKGHGGHSFNENVFFFKYHTDDMWKNKIINKKESVVNVARTINSIPNNKTLTLLETKDNIKLIEEWKSLV